MKLVKDLPEIFEEFGEQRRKAFLEIKEYKERGVPVVGMYCAYFPSELAMAVGAIPVGLCSFANETVPAAEREMPKSMCPLVKSSYGFALEDKCPFFHFSDLVIGETTCDGKKKMYELMAEFKPVFVMELPNSQSRQGLKFWTSEIVRTKEYFEEFFNIVITDEMLRDAIRLGNRIRASLKKLCEVMKLNPAPVLGADIQKMVTGSKYRFDFKNTPEVVEAVAERILEEYRNGKKLEMRPRILVTGCPIGGDSLKVIQAIEDNGGVVVAVENCSGVKSLDRMINEENPNLCEAIAEKYLATGCSIMTPNDNRIELLGRIIDEFQVDGVVEMVLSGCHSTGAESIYIRKFVNEEKKIPYLAIDTDYSSADYGQISTRVAALLEMIAFDKGGESRLDLNHCYKIMLAGFTRHKPIGEILEELWTYTRIPMLVLNAEDEVEAYAGITESDDWQQEKHRVEFGLPGGEGKLVALSTSPGMKVKARELLESLGKGYLRQKANYRDGNGKHLGQGTPDYLWLLAEKNENAEELVQFLKEEFRILAQTESGDKMGLFFSSIQGKEERERLIARCADHTKRAELHIAVGNGFSEWEKRKANREMLEHLYEIGFRMSPYKKLYVIEDYYQELAVEYVADRIGKEGRESYAHDELEKIRKEDQEKGSSLYETLYWYLFMKRSAMQTAAKLGIHRNTLIYRIARINELINLDEKDGSECERLLMAMQIEKELYKK